MKPAVVGTARPESAGPPPDHRTPAPPVAPRLLVLVVIAGLVLGALAWLAAGPRVALGPQRTGDPTLIRDAEAALGDGAGISSVSLARVADGRTTYAGLGDAGGGQAPTADSVYELGSITKTFTGMLLADAVDRGEMRLDDPLATYLPELKDSDAGRATLKQLASHTSGLPSITPGERTDQAWGTWTRGNPYAAMTTDRLLADAKETKAAEPGTFAYSNLGIALLGHAEKRAARSAAWTDLARQRLLDPLGMTHTTFVPPSGEVADLVTPHTSNGRTSDPWSSEGYGPAGTSTRTTAADMAAFATAVLQRKAPGMAALEPVADRSGTSRIGLTWNVERLPSGEVTAKNGGTAGSHTILALDRERGAAALALASTGDFVDDLGYAVLRPDSGITLAQPKLSARDWAVLGAALLLVAMCLWSATRARSRIALLQGVAYGLIGAAVGWAMAPWQALPQPALGALLGVAAAGVLLCLWGMRAVPTLPAKGRVTGIAGLVISLAFVAVCVPLI